MSQTPLTDTRALRNALGCFATGVAIVTTCTPDGRPVGLTINSFAAVSLEPPLVLWSLAQHSQYLEAFQQASHYAIHILGLQQEPLSQLFASRSEERFSTLTWHAGLGGCPLLDDCVARFEVRNTTRHKGGDHEIFLGEVERYAGNPDGAPLIFHGGRYRSLA